MRNTICFEPYSGVVHVSAIEVNARQWGVCRDLAHLGMVLCRSLSIPARMVVGYFYGLQPMDLHAWFGTYVGGRWYSFDATQSGISCDYVAKGYGRDAADVAVYNQLGPPQLPAQPQVSVVLATHPQM